jgi:hypothetical protein
MRRARSGRLVLAVLCLLGTVRAGRARAGEGGTITKGLPDSVMDLVVLITCRLGAAEPATGAGIIVGGDGDRVIIVTANHVVRAGGEERRDLQVRFRSLPGEPAPAILEHDFDNNLDLAVLSVANAKQLGIKLDALAFDRMADVGSVDRGAAVYVLGHPRGSRWQMNVAPDHISRRSSDWLYFESRSIAPGYSGGALLDEKGELLGMLRADQPPDGQAVSIASIVSVLRDWGYPVSLRSKRAADLAGEWKGEKSPEAGDVGPHFRDSYYGFFPENLSFTLKTRGNELFGTVSTKKDKYGIIDGKISGDKVSFSVKYSYSIQESNDAAGRAVIKPQPDVFEHFDGKLSGEEIHFTLQEFQQGSGLSPLEFTARRVSGSP